MIFVEKIDNVHIKVHCEGGIAQELSDYFTFNVPGARFSPAYRNKVWDGKIRLFSTATHYIYGGLLSYIERFAKDRDYVVELGEGFGEASFANIDAEAFISKLNLPFAPYDYQLDTFIHAVRKKRALLLSPTASGKSMMIYLISRFYKTYPEKVLIVVPTTSLVHQMASDFVSYGCPEKYIHKIFSGQEKLTDAPFVITTWQSVYKLPKTWYSQFHCVIGDEAHNFKASSLKAMMLKLTSCPYRFGFTGTLDGTQTHKLVLEGMFGQVRQVTTTAELIESKHLSQFRIKAITLIYKEELKKMYKGIDYQSEIDFIKGHNPRNKFISNLVSSLKQNTLVLFRHIDHGTELFSMIQSRVGERKVFYVDGAVDGELREDIRKAVENEVGCVIVASLGTFSTGINIKNLHNIVFASPSKSRIKTLQSIGRGLRLSKSKDMATLYDIADDLSWKSKKNYTLLHFIERVKMYDDEKFDYKIYNVDLGD